MTETELQSYLLSRYPKENERCEWKAFANLKHAVSGKEGDDVISYVSAISNVEGGHLVMGVEDQSLAVLGIQQFHDFTPENLPIRLAGNCTNLNTERLRVEAFETSDSGRTVWVIHIPKHRPRLPVYAHKKLWQRLGDSLGPMRPERLDAIINEPLAGEDWSAVVVPTATLMDLEPAAIQLARQMYKDQNPKLAIEVDSWSDIQFLDKAKLTAGGRVTRAALLLLGKPEAAHLLSPAPAQITWKLQAEESAYEHFGPPFLLTTSDVLNRIRNIRIKLFPANQLIPTELLKYEPRVILEALHNCIAHQDYSKNERILVTEKPDRLVFENGGGFFEGSYADYISGERTPRSYRNSWLAQAMVQLRMIDTVGYGIYQMFLQQRRRFFPLPDYSRTTGDHVVLEVFGHVLDENYTRLLMERADLPLSLILLLDRVQKRQPISDVEASELRSRGLIEGRKPNFIVSAQVAEATDTRAQYTRDRGLEDDHYKEFIIAHLRKFKRATRKELEDLLLVKLPEVLTEDQKRNKVKNLLAELARDGVAFADRRGPGAQWGLTSGSKVPPRGIG